MTKLNILVRFEFSPFKHFKVNILSLKVQVEISHKFQHKDFMCIKLLKQIKVTRAELLTNTIYNAMLF